MQLVNRNVSGNLEKYAVDEGVNLAFVVVRNAVFISSDSKK